MIRNVIERLDQVKLMYNIVDQGYEVAKIVCDNINDMRAYYDGKVFDVMLDECGTIDLEYYLAQLYSDVLYAPRMAVDHWDNELVCALIDECINNLKGTYCYDRT